MSISDKFRKTAETLGKKIAALRVARLENTPKRALQAKSARIEADHLERARSAMLVLADLHAAGTCPPELAQIKTKEEVLNIMKTRIDHSGGYYSLVDTGQFYDQSPTAIKLRGVVDANNDPAQTAERARLCQIKDLEEKVKFSAIDGFFPTPPDVVSRMVELADIHPDHEVLEPSAGKGDIADAIRALGVVNITTCELSVQLCQLLKAKGYQPHHCDFMEFIANRQFQRVVMNPPFERGAEIDHVRRAYDFLAPGGRLVSVMSAGPFFRSDRKATEFRDWFATVRGENVELPADAFKAAFRSTGVKTVLVVIDR